MVHNENRHVNESYRADMPNTVLMLGPQRRLLEADVL